MFKTLSLVGSFLLSLTLFAQKDKDIPAFGKVDKAELEMKECDFDKNAEAVVLFNVGELSCVFAPGVLTTELQYHVRIKILKDKGLDQANIHIPYYSYRNMRYIKNLVAQTYNLDASGNIVVSKVEKKLIYEKKIDKRSSEQVFTFPEVKVGSVIEYKYSLHSNGLAVQQRPWYFQSSIPVKLSRYITDFPEELEMYAQQSCSLPLDSKTSSRAGRQVKTYTMRAIPALRDEPWISCDDDYLQQIKPQLIAYSIGGRRESFIESWPKVIKELMEDEDFGIQLKKEIPRTADLDEQLKRINDPYQRMVAIHNYVRKNMAWNGYSSLYALDGVKAAWKDKKGTNGEINLILVNLLKDAGLKASPILLSSRDNGRIETAMANTSQFDVVMAYVTIGDKNYVLDGTNKYTPSRLIPYEVMYTEGLVIEKPETYEWGWRTLWDEKQQFKNVVILQGSISEKGQMKGEASITSYDYTRMNRIPKLKNGKEKFIEEYFTSNNPGIEVDTVSVENEDVDSLPLTQRVKFKQTLSSSGDYKYFSANLFTGLERNPFVADTRFSDVFFAANQQYNIIGSFIIPEGYIFEDLPKNIRMIMPDTSISITRRVTAADNQLSVRINLDFKRPFYSTEEYPDFKEFYKRLFAMMNEQFVIRKKATP